MREEAVNWKLKQKLTETKNKIYPFHSPRACLCVCVGEGGCVSGWVDGWVRKNCVHTDLVVFVFEHVFRIAYGVNTYIAQAYSNTYIHVAVCFQHVCMKAQM